MKNKNIFLIFCVFFIISIIAYAAAQLGCCTNPNTPPGSVLCFYDDDTQDGGDTDLADCCPPKNQNSDYYYSNATPQGPTDEQDCEEYYFKLNEDCSSFVNCADMVCCCNSEYALPIPKLQCACLDCYSRDPSGEECSSVCSMASVCGDNSCDGDENCSSCQQDCGSCPSPMDCNDPDYTPKLSNLNLNLARGEKKIELSWEDECPTGSYKISRCEGSGCSPEYLTTVTSTYFSDSMNLKWDTVYTYKIETYYATQDETSIITGDANTGNLECWDHHDSSPFCVHYESYYEREPYKSYILANTGAPLNADDNKAYSCNQNNQLVQQKDCGTTGVCIIESNQPQCLAESDCKDEAGNPFGMFYTQSICEDNKYCFFDKSYTIKESCYKCDQDMFCYDYKSEDACLADNCHIGGCFWKGTLPEFGIGVCAGAEEDNCEFCSEKGTSGMENLEAFNNIFDQCTETKAAALSTAKHYCYYKNEAAKSCLYAICTDYPESDCSSDPCGINACGWYPSHEECHKNTDEISEADCGYSDDNDPICEADFFSPNTTITVIPSPEGVDDRLIINIKDKTSRSGEEQTVTSSDYKTYICVEETGNCVKPFSRYTNKLGIEINNLLMCEEGNTENCWELVDGENHIKYYSIDPYKNIGNMKTITVNACDNCSGPEISSITVDEGTEINDIHYTKDTSPCITVEFYGQAKIKYAVIYNASDRILPLISPNSLAEAVELCVENQRLSDGSYKLDFEAENSRGIPMDENAQIITLPAKIEIDTTPPEILEIMPDEGEVKTSSEVQIKFTFDEPSMLISATLNSEDITSNFTSDYSTQFSIVRTLQEGSNALTVAFRDYAGNINYGQSAFIVNAYPVNISLTEPSYGVSASYTFDMTIQIDDIAECKYFFSPAGNSPLNPEDYFDDDQVWRPFPLYLQQNKQYKIQDFDGIKDPDKSTHKFYVTCKDTEYGLVPEEFDLSVDTTKPNITDAFAYPSPVPIDQPYVQLKVYTDDKAICKYSIHPRNTGSIKTYYESMEGLFERFNEKQFESFNYVYIENLVRGDYAYYVVCENMAELISDVRTITFSIEDIPLQIISPAVDDRVQYTGGSSALLKVVTNKDASCEYEKSGGQRQCLGTCNKTKIHIKNLSLDRVTTTIDVYCEVAQDAEHIIIIIIMDTSPPNMLYVNDTSTLLLYPEYTCQDNKLRVKWLAEEDVTLINYYSYTLIKNNGGSTIINWTDDYQDGNVWRWIDTPALKDKEKYKFKVTSTNTVGIESNKKESDGVTVDKSKCKYCENIKDNCCFIEDIFGSGTDGSCDPDCTTTDEGSPQDPDCNECTNAVGDCCYINSTNGCDFDCIVTFSPFVVVDPDCKPYRCEANGSCDKTNNKWCNSTWWIGALYCDQDICGFEDPDCGFVCINEGACDTFSRKWCEDGEWQSGAEYCARCKHKDSSCPECENNVCDTDSQKWCDNGRWSSAGYCSYCGDLDAACNETCSNGVCDTTSGKWCDDGIWKEEDYCTYCSDLDSSCYVECTNGVCDIKNEKWCDNGNWTDKDYCTHCGKVDDSDCGVACSNGACDTTTNRWCNLGAWTQVEYCDNCDDPACPETCTNKACDIGDKKWCDSGDWTDEDYCDNCGNKDSSCVFTCVEGTCDITANKRCTGGMWVSDKYCEYCSLQDSDCTVGCAEEECDVTHSKVCLNRKWTNESYCSYCEDYDSSCHSGCLNTKDDCCSGISDGVCDPDCTRSGDTDCTNCTSAQGDCCSPKLDAVCDLDCPTGLDPDCADNSCQNSGTCPDGHACKDDSDCESRYCENSTCKKSKCDDGVQNGDEADVDCGGPCDKCPKDKKCNTDSDCESGNCKYKVCKEEDTCKNGRIDGSETDIDCGGACSGCEKGEYCISTNDCASGLECVSGKCSGKTEVEVEISEDTDGDGMPDDWEIRYNLDPMINDADDNYDGDGFTNIEEYIAGTDPTDPNSPGEVKEKTSFWAVFLLIIGLILFISGIVYLYYTGYDQVYVYIGAGIGLILVLVLFFVGLRKTSLVILYILLLAEAYLVYLQYQNTTQKPALRPRTAIGQMARTPQPIMPRPIVGKQRPPVGLIQKRREEKYKEREKLFGAFEQKIDKLKQVYKEPEKSKPEAGKKEEIKKPEPMKAKQALGTPTKEKAKEQEIEKKPKEDVFKRLSEMGKGAIGTPKKKPRKKPKKAVKKTKKT